MTTGASAKDFLLPQHIVKFSHWGNEFTFNISATLAPQTLAARAVTSAEGKRHVEEKVANY